MASEFLARSQNSTLEQLQRILRHAAQIGDGGIEVGQLGRGGRLVHAVLDQRGLDDRCGHLPRSLIVCVHQLLLDALQFRFLIFIHVP